VAEMLYGGQKSFEAIVKSWQMMCERRDGFYQASMEEEQLNPR